ncbi:SDR family oxidoreductase [Vibrio coralliilyticus]|uniref:Short-chain dehydrogenase n=1 Tax=Vibrio coralliilyticus TaxID=190893 RepID=A0AAN0W0H5_9VIBR|nr:SDR family oxidoreductase [Vibrio coralliilyticus]AIW22700.1 short-chain dehydrogenase [Vibrio coralliilyticus]NOH36805.1 SDR family oxidoreductase [Vibrio coralliilyticus]
MNTLITCATSGMGNQIARALTEDNMILTGRDQDKLQSLCESAENRTLSVSLDFFDTRSIREASTKIVAAGKLDRIVFIIPRIPPSSNIFPSDEEWIELYKNYFINPLSLLRQLFDENAVNDGAKIVLISGISSKSALTNYATNNCLRSAWLGQAKAMALTLGEKRISVNTLSLGGVMTESYTEKMKNKASDQNISFEQLMENEVSNVPLRKYASIDDVVGAVLALLGPLSNHMTGQNIMLDGGFFKGY